MDEVPQITDAPLYHERQSKELCALHVLNNLFQKKQTFTKKDLDDICLGLCPDRFFNPHRSMLGLGNYDINVLMAAFKKKGYDVKWWDKRKDVSILAMEHVMGLILNVPSEYKLGFVTLPINRKHWIAIKYLQGQFINLDSKLAKPKPIGNGDFDSLISFLREEMKDNDRQLLLVITQEISDKCLWRKPVVDVASSENIVSNDCEKNGHEKLTLTEKYDTEKLLEDEKVRKQDSATTTNTNTEKQPLDSNGKHIKS